MSLQRVIETARKTGLPVIVTDVAGREPMVILPLEQFESLADGVDKPMSQPEARVIPFSAPLAESEAPPRKDQAAIHIEKIAEPSEDDEEISLEERFYLEPVEDK